METRTEKIFKWIWRINGISLFVLSVAGLVAVVLLVSNIGIFASRDRPEENVLEIAGASIESTALRISDFSEIVGTELLYARLGTQSEYIGSGSSGGVANSRNLLFFDATTKKAHWLLKGNDESIQTISFLTDPPECPDSREGYSACENSKVAIALLLEIESVTERKDKSKSGKRRIVIAAVDGTDMRELVTEVDGLRGVHSIDGARTLLFYAKSGSVRFLDIDPAKRILRADEKLSANE